VELGFMPRHAQLRKETATSAHGLSAHDGHDKRYRLDAKEFITKIEVATYKAKAGFKHRTRIGWISISTNTSKGPIECGIRSESGKKHTGSGK